MSLAEIERDFAQYDDERMPKQEQFTITDDNAANWALRKITQLKAAQARRAQFADAEIQRITSWQKQRDEADEQSIAYFTSLLEMYFNNLRDSGKLGKKKSWSLPHGVLKIRRTQPKFARDDKAILAWAQENAPEVVQDVPKLLWTELKDRLTVTDTMRAIDSVTGCLVEGLQVAEPERDVFSVSVIETDSEGW